MRESTSLSTGNIENIGEIASQGLLFDPNELPEDLREQVGRAETWMQLGSITDEAISSLEAAERRVVELEGRLLDEEAENDRLNARLASEIVRSEELERTNKELQRENDILKAARKDDVLRHNKEENSLRKLATIDPITELRNRSAFDNEFPRYLERSRRELGGLAIMAVDIDNFKGVNDAYGHPSADVVLARLADKMKVVVREGGGIYRIGGDEFMFVFPRFSHDLHIDEVDEVLEHRRVEIESVLSDCIVAEAINRNLLPGVSKHPYTGVTIGAGIHDGFQDEIEFRTNVDTDLMIRKKIKHDALIDKGIYYDSRHM